MSSPPPDSYLESLIEIDLAERAEEAHYVAQGVSVYEAQERDEAGDIDRAKENEDVNMRVENYEEHDKEQLTRCCADCARREREKENAREDLRNLENEQYEHDVERAPELEYTLTASEDELQALEFEAYEQSLLDSYITMAEDV